MARTVRDTKLETRAARDKLAVRHEPYWRLIEEGAHLGYRKGARGGRWVARYRPEDGGGYRKRTIGAADDHEDADGERVFSFRQAQEAARRFFGEQRAHDAGGSVRRGPYTVGDALDDYLARMASDGKKSVGDARFRADRHIRPDLGDVEVSRLTTDRIRRWLDALASRPAMLRAKPGKENRYREETVEGETARKRRASANRSLTTLKAALNHAWGEGKVSTDAAWRRVKPYKKVDEARVQYLSEDEITRLVNAADPALRELIRGALYTGARYGELTRLKAGDFHTYKHYDGDLRRYIAVGTVTIADSKSGKPRHVALTDDARAYFERATAGLKGDDLIFRRADGEPWAKSHQQRPLKAACAAASINPPASFHILRHTYASHLAMAGVPFPVIAANLGHADTRMVSKHYAHLAPDYVSATIRAAGLGYTLPADDRGNVETLRAGATD